MLVGEVDTETDTEGDGDDDEEDNEGAPPLEAVAPAGVCDAGRHLLVALVEVDVGLLGLLLGTGDDGILLDNEGVQVLEETGQLGDRLLDLLQLVVSRTDIAEDGGSLAGSVGSELRARRGRISSAPRG